MQLFINELPIIMNEFDANTPIKNLHIIHVNDKLINAFFKLHVHKSATTIFTVDTLSFYFQR